jgi:hypothetical protein
MSITNRQKKIANPYAESLDTAERSGAGYDYNSRRNRFVQDAIQERYIYFFQFPRVGETLRVKPEDQIENPEIQQADLLAYFALYPQNGKLVGGSVVEISNDESIAQLDFIKRQLENNEVIEKYTSRTSEVSFLEEYQDRQNLANLIAIPSAHSNHYRNKLRQSFDLPKYQYSGEVSLESVQLSPRASTYVITDTNVDLYDWRKNCLAGDKDKTYYNSTDRNYYFTRRTDQPDLEYLNYNFNTMRMLKDRPGMGDPTALWNGTAEEGRSLYNTLVNEAIKETLQASGKYSNENYQSLVNLYSAPNKFALYTDLDRRPGSRWTYAVKINAQDIENLPSPDSVDPSKEETEISILEKAKRIIGPENKSVHTVEFQVEDLIRYIFFTRNLLREYDEKLFDLNLGPELLNNIDLGREIDRLNSLFALMELFCNYNKITLQDLDYIQMYFTEDYALDHMVINGSFYYQGTGGRAYLNEEVESVRVINAFGIFVPTTFSIISNCIKIYNEGKNTSENNRREVLNFMVEYLFPRLDLDMIKRQQGAVSELERRRAARRKKIFETYSRLTKGDPKDFEFLYSNRPLKYTISSTLTNMDCDTGQVAAAQYALKFWKAADSKTRLQSVIREAIILIRDEVIEDETTKAILTKGAQYSQNPSAAGQDIEKYVNSQIYCSLDVIGDFIEDQFLDPLGLPPDANSLTRKTISQLPKIEFKKCSMSSSKSRQSALYQKMLETILLNFVKSIVAGIAKDVIRALLGCGPNDPNTELSNNFRKEDYGFVDLTELLYGIDIVELAATVGLKNVNERVLNGEVSTERTPATKEQLTALISDISKMSTPVELQQLLNGDADNDLLQHLLETVSGKKDIGDDYIDVDVYNMMNFTTGIIRNYFMLIGDALDGTLDNLGEMGFTSPLEAYCNKKDNYINPLTLDFSVPEIEAQYNDIVNSKIAKINSLCAFLLDLKNIELEIQRLIDSLPVLEWYNDLLQDIADLSNQFFEYLAEKFSKLFGQEQENRAQPVYNLYTSAMGVQLFYEIFFSLRELLINQLYFDTTNPNQTVTYFQTPAGANPNRLGFSTTISENFWSEDEKLVKGNFGGRKNDWTPSNVYKFIWSDPRTTNYPSPARLNIPQYRNPLVPPNDYFDAAYYSIRNSPEALIRRLDDSPNLLAPSQISKINYGGPRVYSQGFNINRIAQFFGNLGNDNSESNYLLVSANRIYSYLREVEQRSPYTGWTGATYLRCASNNEGNIRILFDSKPSGQLDLVSSYNPIEIYNEVSVDSTSIAITETNYDSVDYRIYNGLEYQGSVISVDSDNVLSLDYGDNTIIKMPLLAAGPTFNLWSNLSIGVQSEAANPATRPGSIYERYPNSRVFQNYTQRIDTLINNSVINDLGKRRMPRYIAGLNKPPLQKTDDICVTAEEVLKGESGLQKVQASMFSFFMNIMPMAIAYGNWRSVGTVEMITDYLTGRLVDDLKEKQLLGPFYELIPFIRLVFPHIEGDEEFDKNPIILDSASPMENTKNIVRAAYIGILDNISETSEYSNVNKSVFDPSTNLVTIQRLFGDFYKNIAASGDLESYLPASQRADAEAVRDLLRTLYNPRNDRATKLGMLLGTYYFPIAFQIASYMIYLDKGIKYSERYVDTKYRMLVEESTTDDAILTSLKGQLVDDFSKSHLGFPVSYDSWNGVPIRYYGTVDAKKRIKELRQLLGSIDTSEGFREFGYLPLYDAQDQYSLLRLRSPQLLEVFPDFWSPEALLDAPPLYPGREIPTLNQVTQEGGISSVARYQVATWLDGLRRLFLDSNDRFAQTTKARAQIRVPGSSFGNGYTSYPFTGPPDRNPAGEDNYLYNAIQANLGVDENPNDRFTPDQLRYLFQNNSARVVQKVIDYNNQFGAESYTLEPTIRTNDQYFESLGEIFRLYSTPVHSPEAAQSLIANPLIPEITEDTQLYPYFIRSKPENIFGQQVSIPYLYNYSYGVAYKFFNQYLYNKYFNYRTDKAKILQEINILEKLITRNE